MAFPIVEAVFCKAVIKGGMVVGGTTGCLGAFSFWSVDAAGSKYNGLVDPIKRKLVEEKMKVWKAAQGPSIEEEEAKRALCWVTLEVPESLMPPPLTSSEIATVRLQQLLADAAFGLGIFACSTGLAYLMTWRTSSYLRSRLGTTKREIMQTLETDSWFAWKAGVQLPIETACAFSLAYFGSTTVAMTAYELGSLGQHITATNHLFALLFVPFFTMPFAVFCSAPLTAPVGILMSKHAVKESLQMLKELPDEHLPEEELAEDE
jgi:hypothetical protein